MLCITECEDRAIENRQGGFFERIFQKYLNGNRKNENAAKVRDSQALRLSREASVLLREGELCTLEMSGQCRILCSQGSIWVTRSGKSCDYILEAGEDLTLQGEGKIIISGSPKSSVIRICNE